VIPYRLTPGEPIPSPDLRDGIEFPPYLAELLD